MLSAVRRLHNLQRFPKRVDGRGGATGGCQRVRQSK
jgi:hypothetical protein